MHTIFTIGYQPITPAALKQFAELNEALVADIRFSPRTRLPHWNAGPLRTLLGDRYVQVQAFGNRNYKGEYGPDTILVSPEAGLRWAEAALAHRDVVLLCACKHHEQCHRSEVAELIHQKLGNPVYHLKPHELDRRITPEIQPEQKGLL